MVNLIAANIAANLERLRADIADEARRAGRDPATVRLMAVSKTFPPAAVREAALAGQRLFGENRVQEAEEKIPVVADPSLEWHLIGHLQSNKVNRAVELFDAIQSLDSPKLAAKVGRAAIERGKSLDVYIQINIGDEPQKYGVSADQLPEMIETVKAHPSLVLRGLMAIPPFDADPRPHFRRLRQLRDAAATPMTELSMGMSGDWRAAVQEGSTLIRIGTAIFGRRS